MKVTANGRRRAEPMALSAFIAYRSIGLTILKNTFNQLAQPLGDQGMIIRNEHIHLGEIKFLLKYPNNGV